MKKEGRKITKRITALIMVLFLLSINSFAAVVSDNDGSAFITKAEFDSLKNTFQTQIDQYNTSIDNKIDGAIAAYLAGIRHAAKITHVSLATSAWIFPLRSLKSWKEMSEILKRTNFEIDVAGVAHAYNAASSNQKGSFILEYKCPATPCPWAFHASNESNPNSIKVEPYKDAYIKMFLLSYKYYGNTLDWACQQSNAGSSLAWLTGIQAPMYDASPWTPDNTAHNTSANIIQNGTQILSNSDLYPCGLKGNMKWDNQGWYIVNSYVYAASNPGITSAQLGTLYDRMKGTAYPTTPCTGPVLPSSGPANNELSFYGQVSEKIPYLIASSDAVVPCWIDSTLQNCGMVYAPKSYFTDRSSSPYYAKSIRKWTTCDSDSSTLIWRFNPHDNGVPLWPTWGSFKSTEIKSYDTLRYAKNLVLEEPYDINKSSTDYRLYGGVAINQMQGGGSMEFEATFGNMTSSSNGNMKVLFKKNGWFTQSEIDSSTTIPYKMDGTNVTTPGWLAGSSTHKFRFEGLNKGDYIVMQWVSNDSNFGGILNSVGEVTEEIDG